MQVEMEGLLVFILEADASTAIELDAIAAHLGCRKISAFHYCEIADRWLDHFTPDLAIVDPCVDQGGCVKRACQARSCRRSSRSLFKPPAVWDTPIVKDRRCRAYPQSIATACYPDRDGIRSRGPGWAFA
jgi:hypothetical protein